jgi:NAD(P)-dependent dehydrogenase (short-subunit alcohol dehydrogenase family)
MNNLSGMTTIVVGASRGLGRGIAEAFAAGGAPVIAVSRTAAACAEPTSGAGTIQPVAADAGDATAPASLIDRYQPRRSFWWPARARTCARCSTRRGKPSRSTGTPM